MQRLVQTAHAAIEAARNYLTLQVQHPNLVVLGVENEIQLELLKEELSKTHIRFCIFCENDLNDSLTAIATEPISGNSRRFFRHLKLLQET